MVELLVEGDISDVAQVALPVHAEVGIRVLAVVWLVNVVWRDCAVVGLGLYGSWEKELMVQSWKCGQSPIPLSLCVCVRACVCVRCVCNVYVYVFVGLWCVCVRV